MAEPPNDVCHKDALIDHRSGPAEREKGEKNGQELPPLLALYDIRHIKMTYVMLI